MTSVMSSFVAGSLCVMIMRFRASSARLTKFREVIAVYPSGWRHGKHENEGTESQDDRVETAKLWFGCPFSKIAVEDNV